MVVDSFICQWVVVVAVTKAYMEALVVLIQDLTEYYYTNDGLIASTQPKKMKRAFDVLEDLFDRSASRQICGIW